MDVLNSNNLIKQPSPNIIGDSLENSSENSNSNATSNNKKRKIKMPNVGVISPSYVSTTPQEDDFVRRQQENPKTKFSMPKKIQTNFNIQNGINFGIIGLALISTIGLIVKKIRK